MEYNTFLITKYSVCLIIILYFSSTITVLSKCLRENEATQKVDLQNQGILRLDKWEMHFGDLVSDSEKHLLISDYDSIKFWKKTPVCMLLNEGKNIIWLRTKLPVWHGSAPAVFINRTEQLVFVYLDGKEIYTNSNFISDTTQFGVLSFRWYLVKLPEDFDGKYIYFRFISKSKDIGMASQVSLGSLDEFISQMASENLADIIIGAIILLAAIVMLTIFLFLKRQRFYLGLSLFFFSTGTLISLNNPFINFLFNNTSLIFFLDNFCLLFAPFFFVALEEFVLPKYQKAVRFAWKIHLIFLAAAIICLITTNITSEDLLTPFFILLLCSSNTVLFLLIKSFSRKRIDSIILLIGTTVFSLLATTEIFLYYFNYYSDTWYTRTYMLQWGTLFFVLSLIALAMYRYLQDLKGKQIAQEQLVRQQQLALEATQREIQTREHFTHQLLQSQDNERKRIALELHDAVGQELLIIRNLASLCIKAKNDPEKKESSIEYLNDISSASSSVIETVRNLSKNLHPYQLDNLGLSEALEAVIQRVENKTSLNFIYEIDNIDGIFSHEHELHIYRIVQELLNNIIKHSQASNANIIVGKRENNIEISVKDNGKGFAKSKVDNDSYNSVKGFGLSGIQERISILRGSISTKSEINKGTSIQIIIPFNGQ